MIVDNNMNLEALPNSKDIYPDPENKNEFSLENPEVLIAATIELFRAHSVKKINEGNNGVIGCIEQEKLELFGSLFDEAEDGVAIKFLKSLKLLKIGNREAIEKEFEAQRKVHAILSKNESLASCPKPYIHCSFEITPNLKEDFEELGFSGTFADVMFMDFVPGKDLAHIQYQELLKRSIAEYRHKSGKVARSEIGAFEGLSDEDIERLSFGELHAIISNVFFEPTPPTEEGFRAGIRNANLVVAELGRLEFKIAPQILSRINKTIQVLEQNGIFLVDCHDRNIMIEGDITSPDAEVYFIDFGNVHFQSSSGQKFDYESGDGEIRFVNPKDIPVRLARINALSETSRIKRESQPTLEQSIERTLTSVQTLFSSRNEKSLGLSVSKTKENNKVSSYEKSIKEALLDLRSNTELATRKNILKNFRDNFGKKISVETDLYATRYFLTAVLGSVYALRKEGAVNEDEMSFLIDKVYASPDFTDILVQHKLPSDFSKVTKEQLKRIIENSLKKQP